MNQSAQRTAAFSSTIDNDLYCTKCGYNLRTCSVHGSCPECGLPVSTTLTIRQWIAENELRMKNPPD